MRSSTKIGILSLGCPRNLVDSEHIVSRLVGKGYHLTDITKSDVALINTCAFIEDAKKESIDSILDLIELKREGKIRKIIVYGCLTQRYWETLQREFPQVDAFVGRVALDPGDRRSRITDKHYAYLKICDGCLSSCSFCAIPAIKGKFASLEMDSLIAQARMFDRRGVSELNIVGQDITGYGTDLYGKRRLAELAERIVHSTSHIGWIRLLYLYPSRICDDLLRVIRDNPRICKYIDIPVQHCDDRILRLMRRGSTRRALYSLIEKIRKIIPGVFLRTSVIVGFPTESEKDFSSLVRFVQDIRFERLGAFMYSREEGTPAYALTGQVPQKVKEERFNRVMQAQQEISQKVNQTMLGRTLTVLVDGKEGSAYLGRTEYDAPEVDGSVYIHTKQKLVPGQFVKARIVDTLDYDLVGEI